MLIGVVVLGVFSLRAAFAGGGSTVGRLANVGAVRKPTRLDVSLAPWKLAAPVSSSVVLADASDLLVVGGLAAGDVSTDKIWRLDTRTGSTSTIGRLSTAVHDSAGAMIHGQAVLFGGGSTSTVGQVQALASGASTTEPIGALPQPRSDVSAVTIGAESYILGGFNGATLQSAILSTGDGSHFLQVGTLPRPVRYGAATALDGQVYLIGGDLGTSENAATGGQTDDIQRFDPRTGRTTVIGHLPIDLGHATAIALHGRLFVLGGRSAGSLSNAIFEVNPTSGAVRRVGTLAQPRSDASAAVVGGKAYLVGGETSGPLAPLDNVLVASLVPTDGTSSATTGVVPLAHVNAHNIYAADGPNMLSPVVRHVPYRIYVPESGSSYVDVIDPHTYKVIDRYQTGLDPQHVIPAWNLKTIYAANDLGNSLTPISPYTGKPEGSNIPVDDPYNMYFTPNGKYAIVVEEANQTLAFRNPITMALERTIRVNCPGVDHGDFSADGSFAIFSCEFSAKMVKIDLKTYSVAGYLTIPGSALQDVKLDPTGKTFYSADLNHGGVYLISAKTFKVIGFIPTGRDAHGLYVSRDAKYLYVSNRGSGSVSVVDFTTRKVKTTWHIPGGGSPDMGNLSPDGKVLWLSGRYNSCVYAISTVTGHLLAEIPVPNMPHGLLPWPQPGRYSIGHTGIMR